MSLKNKTIPHMILYVLCAVFLMVSSVAMAAEKTGPEAVQDSKFVSIDFNDVDINVFIKFISKLTSKNFVVDNRVKGNVTIISPTKISVKDAYKVFESVLDINGFSTVESGSVIKIVPTPHAKSDNIDTRMISESAGSGNSEDRLVTRLVPLKYAQANELKTLFSPLVPKGSVILAYRDTNMLIITSSLSSIDRLVKIVDVIDKQSTGKKISVIPVKNADAEKLVKSLTTIFSARLTGKRTLKNTQMDVKMVADERTNAIILLSSKVEALKVKELIGLLDQEVPKGDEKIRVYYLEHASAENMVKVLLEIPSKEAGKAAPGQKKAPLLSTKVKIMADKATNSLIIMADKEDYPVLEEVIRKLDIPRAMVYIECLIMEVNVNRGLDIGTEWQVAQSGSNNTRGGVMGFSSDTDTAFSSVTGLAAGNLPAGFSVGVLGRSFNIGGIEFRDISAVVQAFQNDKDVHILATPQILTTENEEATITVGKNVPYQTRSSADAGTETYSSYEYKDVGTTLKITPQISKDRLVRLNVYQELTRLDSSVTQLAGVDRPTTLKRQIETTIIVEDASSVVIGGLIDESITKSEKRVPCLGGIPGLGWAFKSVSDGADKTNLYVFLTPRVIKNPLEGQKLYDQKRSEIEAIKRGEVILYNEKGKKEDIKTVNPK